MSLNNSLLTQTVLSMLSTEFGYIQFVFLINQYDRNYDD